MKAVALTISIASLLWGLAAGTAAADPVEPAGQVTQAEAGAFTLRMISAEGPTARFRIAFDQAHRLTVAGGHLRILDSTGALVEDVPPAIAVKSGGTVTGEFTVEGPDEFSFTVKDGVMLRFSWGSFWCGTAATISGAAGGALIGGPVGAGFGIGTGIAAAATC
ncbi:hypothetical protein [Amycolatopsis magusensis]|uniref:hypothetical protein n=1 Tax=Amycolatopsis magusensis TaxID=882444 RepID=UPI0024A7B1CA|nr:hypothetical protein [Amycolatopsis magusensis]MDI5979872.1 hypothetical protein [Amycolatopsis magusensis]